MVTIHVQADCGNSPKNHFVKDLSIAFCDVYEFTSVKGNRVQAIISYRVPLS